MRALLGTAVVLVLATSGCGGDSEPTAQNDIAGESAGPRDDGVGCDVIAAEAVGDITGAEITDSSELPRGCQWNLDDAGPTGAAAYNYQSIDAAIYEDNLEAANAAGFTVEPVNDIGETAFWRLQVNAEGATTNGELWVRTPDGALQVSAQGIEYGEEIQDHQRQIAQRILDQMG